MSKNNSNSTPLLTHLVAGGAAGLTEACTCHPLDTIKVRMQLSKSVPRNAAVRFLQIHACTRTDEVVPLLKGQRLGFFGVGVRIVKNESFWALYKGLGAVVSGIVPKMAIRFSSFELYKSWMADEAGKVSTSAVFLGKAVLLLLNAVTHTKRWLAGLAAGTTEAMLVVSPMDLIKIRLQVCWDKGGAEHGVKYVFVRHNATPWLIP